MGKSISRTILAFSLALSVISQGSLADNEAQQNTEKIKPAGPYCGLYCIYSVMKLAGKQADFRQLLKSEYIGSKKGSSLTELKKAAQDNGLYAQAIKNLTLQELKASKYPLILHVKRDNQKNEYNHYVLFPGNRDGQAVVFDPPNPTELVPFYDLVPRWNGLGLIVSAEPVNLAKVFAPARKQFIIFAGFVIAIIAVIRFLRKYITVRIGTIRGKWLLGFSIAQGTGLVLVGSLAGMVFHFVGEAGFLAHPGATWPVVKANLASFIPKVTAKDVEKINDSDTVLIDARQITDYEAGHIYGAINIPTTLCAAGRSAKLAKVKKDSRLVIYCQSKGCPYAEKVAANLMDDGFNNIAIYKGGWVDWEKYNSKK